MTNKLKLTTALASSLLVLGASSAVAQTTVSGNLALSYLTSKSENKAKSFRGFGKESQINISNKGKLNNGLDYVAGFSIEMDGGDGMTASSGSGAENPTVNTLQGQQSENVYIDFISGNTTVSIGADHFQNMDTNMSHIVGFGYIAPDGVNDKRSLYPSNVENYQAYGIGISQKTDIGTFGALYTPTALNGQAYNDIFNAAGKIAVERGAESAYDLTYKGDLGIKGLNLGVSYMSAARNSTGVVADMKSTRIGAQYNFGQFTLGYDRSREENGQAMTAKASGTKYNGDSYGIAYAVNKDVSVGYTYAEAKADVTTGAKKEYTNIIAVGYNLGPVSVQGQYKNAQNVAGDAASDGQQLGVYLNTKF